MQRPPTWKKRQELRTGAERKKQERAAFSKTSHIEAKAGRDSVMWSFIHSPSWSFNSYCLSTPCQTQLGDADRETNKGTRESGEGSPGVTGGASGKGVRKDCLEEGTPSNLENASLYF